ncbi:MAG: hypothetical protein D6814_15270 [Calditrichaeota bacterium]|nr:MAG: hypothetical protein D6814_15270 [Calditrichota bacterium]
MATKPSKTSPIDWEQDHSFKHDLIKDILYQIDYQAATRNKVVDMSEEEMISELSKLSTRALLNWYEAFLYIRSELMFAGYELNGLKVIDRPIDSVKKLMEKDPNFDLNQYIF